MLPVLAQMFKHAIATPELQSVVGTDAVASAHGPQCRRIIDRVHVGQSAIGASVAAQSRATESLHMKQEIGSLGLGLKADIIALDSDPLPEITAVRRVVFVMKGGIIYKNIVGTK